MLAVLLTIRSHKELHCREYPCCYAAYMIPGRCLSRSTESEEVNCFYYAWGLGKGPKAYPTVFTLDFSSKCGLSKSVPIPTR